MAGWSPRPARGAPALAAAAAWLLLLLGALLPGAVAQGGAAQPAECLRTPADEYVIEYREVLGLIDAANSCTEDMAVCHLRCRQALQKLGYNCTVSLQGSNWTSTAIDACNLTQEEMNPCSYDGIKAANRSSYAPGLATCPPAVPASCDCDTAGGACLNALQALGRRCAMWLAPDVAFQQNSSYWRQMFSECPVNGAQPCPGAALPSPSPAAAPAAPPPPPGAAAPAPSPGQTVAGGPSSSGSSSSDGSSGLSAGAAAGIAVGVAAAAAAAAALGWAAYRRRRRQWQRQQPAARPQLRPAASPAAGSGGASDSDGKLVSEAAGSLLGSAAATAATAGTAGTAGTLETDTLIRQDTLINYIHTQVSRRSLAQAARAASDRLEPPRAASGGLPLYSTSKARSSGGVDVAPWEFDFGELTILRVIGQGSFGRVYLATWRQIPVAAKILLTGLPPAGASGGSIPTPEAAAAALALSASVLEKLEEESRLLASLRHPAIINFLGFSREPPCMVTEFAANGSLLEVLQRAGSDRATAAQLSWWRRLGLLLDAAAGMLYLHSRPQPVIHRDLKSPNLLVDSDWHVKVTDFNLSRILEDQGVHSSSVAVTNPRWLAPEVILGGPASKASDVFSFGVVMWELLTWQLPWARCDHWQIVGSVVHGGRLEVPPAEHLPGLDAAERAGLPAYLALLRRCCAQEPGERPDFEAIVVELRAQLEAAARAHAASNGGAPPHAALASDSARTAS